MKVKIYFVLLGFLFIFLNRQTVSASESLLYVHQDHLGSTTLMTDSSGKKASKQVYFPFGEIRTTEGSLTTEKHYTGQVSDKEDTGLLYYNARYYDPVIGKFTQADSMNDGANRYAYVKNNPVIRIDSSGKRGAKIAGKGSSNSGSPKGSQSLITSMINKGNKRFLEELENKYRRLYADYYPEFSGWQRQNLTRYGEYFPEFDIEDKLSTLSHYLYNEIPYSSKLLSVWTEQEQFKATLNNPKLFSEMDTEQLQYGLEIIHNLENAYGEENTLWNLKNNLPLYRQAEEDLFICYNFADTYQILSQELFPDIPVFAGGLPGHAFNFTVIDNRLYTVDPTWNTDLTDIQVDMQLRPFFDWSKVGINENLITNGFDTELFYRARSMNVLK